MFIANCEYCVGVGEEMGKGPVGCGRWEVGVVLEEDENHHDMCLLCKIGTTRLQ